MYSNLTLYSIHVDSILQPNTRMLLQSNCIRKREYEAELLHKHKQYKNNRGGGGGLFALKINIKKSWVASMKYCNYKESVGIA